MCKFPEVNQLQMFKEVNCHVHTYLTVIGRANAYLVRQTKYLIVVRINYSNFLGESLM